MSQAAYLSPEDIELLRETIVFLVDKNRVPYGTIAEGADITRQTLRNFVKPDKPDLRLRTLVKLHAWIGENFVQTGKLPGVLSARWLKSGWHDDSPPDSSAHRGNIRQLFPEVPAGQVHQVPDWFMGHYVIYRPAAFGGDFIRATLSVSPAEPHPTFENFYKDSNNTGYLTTGTVLNVGSALQLLGHLSSSSTLKLIVFEYPQGPDRGTLHGIVTSAYKRDHFFASRCVAIQVADRSESEDAPEEDAWMKTGVFNASEIAEEPWRDEYESLAHLVGNGIGGEQVMFLDPTFSTAPAPNRRSAGGGQ